MALEVKLIKLYNLKSGALRAQLQYGNKKFSVKCGKKTNTLISMPVGFTSFEVVEITNEDINKSVTIQTLNPNPEKIRIDFIQSQFI
jgi:hypothetical protein